MIYISLYNICKYHFEYYKYVEHFYEVFDHSSKEQNHLHKPSSNFDLKVEEYIVGILFHSTSQILAIYFQPQFIIT